MKMWRDYHEIIRSCSPDYGAMNPNVRKSSTEEEPYARRTTAVD
jgi:hypothetical protein